MSVAPPDPEQGAAAQAIASAEAALAQQNTASSQLDMQVIAAILNAHRETVEGGEALTALQRDIEAAVDTRSDLDTPAGARDFQRFLIGKLRDIRAVVLDASLDATSKSALMAAWTSLYEASRSPRTEPDAPREQVPASNPPAVAALADDPGATVDLPPDALPLGDSGSPAPPTAPPPVAATPPPVPPSAPALGAAPGSLGSWGLPLPSLQGGAGNDPVLGPRDDVGWRRRGRDDPDADHHGEPGHRDETHALDASTHNPESPAAPITVTLPDGQTVTVASPQLAAAITAAVGGTPSADAFRQQGITIPEPGTAVTDPVDPQQLRPGDVGIFTDRHALALSRDTALLDGQIQRIASVGGPNFLGWEHPPAASAPAAAPAEPATPAPTRPAAAPAGPHTRPAGPPGGG
ncbi:MAG: DUF4226 domain-containing protein [Mycobacterium sp.]